MHHTILTIGREYGSGGRKVAQILSGLLDIPYYDKELIEKAAKNSTLDPKDLECVDEHPVSPFLYMDAKEAAHIARYGQTIGDTLYQLQSRIIRQMAEKESCIIVGRCGNYVLRNRPYCLHVFLYAPLPVRIQCVMERSKISEDEARILVRKTDRMRRSYYNYYTDLRWGGRDQFDLLMDSSILGIEGTAEMLKTAYQQLVKIPESEMMNRPFKEPFRK